MKFIPHKYQQYAIDRIIEQPAIGLFLAMGLGKTVITLSAIYELMHDRFEVERVLVIAPLRVAQTVWAAEVAKWEHLQGLTVSRVLGTAAQRKEALRAGADIYVINRENVEWLVNCYPANAWPFDMVVIDELSGFKSNRAARFRALRRIRPRIGRIVGLTGTPAPNGLMDLWAQIYLLDKGARLGKTIGGYRERFFTPGRRNGHVVFDWEPKPGAAEKVYKLLSDICVSMRSQDYLDLPERFDRVVPVQLGAAAKAYRELEKESVLALCDGIITAATAAVVTGKLLQLANGAVYDEDGHVHEIHRAKLEALSELVEAASGQPVLVYYAYRHDQARILEALKDYKPQVLSTAQDVEDWNAGHVKVMLAHPDSAGHGLNLQEGGCTVVWFGLTWSLEKYQQANARLHRQGQNRTVIVHHLIAEGTMDEQVIRVLTGKDVQQSALIEAVKARLDGYA